MRIDSLSDLPQKYQEQALIQCAAQEGKRLVKSQEMRRSKFGNKKTQLAHLHFDSKKEARRFQELYAMLQAGEIIDLRLQQDFTLQEAFTDPDGRRVCAIRYRADFTYMERHHHDQRTGGSYDEWEPVVEDVKNRPTRTKEYILKKKLMKDKLGIEIREV